MKMYKTAERWRFSGEPLIQEIEVIKATEKTVTIRGHFRENRISKWHRWHDTQEAAIDHLRKKFNREIERSKQEITKLEADLKELENYQSS